MLDSIGRYFSTGGFLPHGYCFAWDPILLWTLVISNLVIVVAYYSIPLGLVYFVRKRPDLRFKSLFILFALFILACGTTHLIDVVTIWKPIYRLDAIVLVITAGVSAITAVVLWPILPRVLGFLEQSTTDQQNLKLLNRKLSTSVEQLEQHQIQLEKSERNFRLIFDEAPIGKAVITTDGRFMIVNQVLCRMLDYSEQDLLQKHFQDITHPEDLKQDENLLNGLLNGGTSSYCVERRYLSRSGRVIPVQLDISVLRDDDGVPIHLISQIQDISLRKQAEQSLRESHIGLERSLAQMTRWHREMNILSELSSILQSCENQAEIMAPVGSLSAKLFPDYSGVLYTFSTTEGKLLPIANWGDPQPHDHAICPEDCWAVRTGHARWAKSEDGLKCHHLDDLPAEADALCVPMTAQGELNGLLVLRQKAGQHGPVDDRQSLDVERLAIMTMDRTGVAIANLKLRETLREQTVRDTLTGLYNRRFLDENLPREISRAQREKTPLSVLMIDADHFKSINDTHGHEVGDEVLRAIGAVLKRELRRGDLVCRFGGEEFTILMPGATVTQAIVKAEAIQQSIRTAGDHLSVPLTQAVTISIGIASYPHDAGDASSLLQAADAMLYEAKRRGRDLVFSRLSPSGPTPIGKRHPHSA